MKRQGHLFSFGVKMYECNVCREMLTALDFGPNESNVKRDGLQYTCRDCKNKAKVGKKSSEYCDLCNQYSYISHTVIDGDITFFFCSSRCCDMWVNPDKYYE